MKFKIKDAANECYTVEKIDADVEVKEDDTPVNKSEEIDVTTDDACKKAETVGDADDFTADEKKLMKKLLKHADELLAMLDDESDDGDFSEEALELGAEPEKDADEKVEEVVDSDDLKKEKAVCDSKKSFGAIERSTTVCDSELANDDEISEIWSKRYGG